MVKKRKRYVEEEPQAGFSFAGINQYHALIFGAIAFVLWIASKASDFTAMNVNMDNRVKQLESQIVDMKKKENDIDQSISVLNARVNSK